MSAEGGNCHLPTFGGSPRQRNTEEDERHLLSPSSDGGVANLSPSIQSTSPEQRNWSRLGDFLTGRYNSETRVWSYPGSPRQYPMIPVIDTLLESQTETQSNPRCAHRFSETALGETGLHPQNIVLSSKLPPAVWYVLAKSLGIKLSPTDRPVFATFLHVLTLIATFAFALPGAWYTIYDIHSEFSKTTVLIGSVQLVIGFIWACMGMYAHKLAGRLFSNKNFVECVRVHSKTFLKISTSWLTIVLAVVVVAVNCYEASHIVHDESCGTILVNDVVCKMFFVGRVCYAFCTLIWNVIVAYVVFSVCRTHTIGIRRFMRELTLDARVYEDFCLQQYNIMRERNQNGSNQTPNVNDLEESWFIWDDAMNDLDPGDESVTSRGVFLNSIRSGVFRRRSSALPSGSSYASGRSNLSRRSDGLINVSISESGQGHSSSMRRQSSIAHSVSVDAIQENDIGENKRSDGGVVVGDGARNSSGETAGAVFEIPEGNAEAGKDGDDPFDENADEKEKECQASANQGKMAAPAVLSNDDLLFSYWKFMRRLCVTSRFLQRWLASWIAFVVIWDGYFVIYWTSHNATLIGILEFLVPLILLLLMCSAYAEVNAEGERLLKTICPLEERLAVIFYFNQHPLSVKVFSFMVTYNAMMTVILGFSVAFASRMILDEINRT